MDGTDRVAGMNGADGGLGGMAGTGGGLDDTSAWIQEELSGCDLKDRRLDERLRTLVGDLSARIGQGIPMACQDWSATKAAYRFLDNDKVDEAVILAGHFQATRSRFDAANGPILVLHDTTEFSFKRDRPDAIGKTHKCPVGRDKAGRPVTKTICGILMHSSFVVTPEGLPLGLAAIKFWTRQEFKGITALSKKINMTRIPIEQKESIRWIENLRQSTELLGRPGRCVHIGDRESDIYELFCAAHDAGTHFCVRTCVDRLAESGDTTIAKEMDVAPHGIHMVELADRHGKNITAQLEVRFRQMMILPPIGKQKQYPPLTVTAIHAREINVPEDREPLEWKLLTDVPVATLGQATEKLDWYAMRWKIETFHKILKSGCHAEDAKLRTAQRLANLLAIYCIVSWRIFWLCMINRTSPQSPPSTVFTDVELQLLDHADPKAKRQNSAKRKLSNSASPQSPREPTKTITHYLYAVARLGGYLSRAHDPPPGNKVLWRGFTRLLDLHLGYQLGAKLVGN